ncbi:hypothetical protein RYX36_023231, partial [Vicia faba]
AAIRTLLKELIKSKDAFLGCIAVVALVIWCHPKKVKKHNELGLSYLLKFLSICI